MSILTSVTNVFKPINIPEICKTEPKCDEPEYKKPENDCKTAKPDECSDGREYKSNTDYKDHDYTKPDWKDAKNENCEPHNKWNTDYKDHDYTKSDWKDARNEECETNKEHADSRYDGGKYDGGKYDGGKYDGGWKDAKNDNCEPQKDYCEPKDNCEPQKDYCEPQKNYCDPKPADCGEVLAKYDFSHGDLGSYGPDHSGDMQGALASMSSGHALDYAIDQMGPADHFDVGHFDAPADTLHDVHHVA
ncbi:MAG: hypothetical protein ACJ8EF_01600 [Bradyrhizobium sp.]|jgi:hypothetical protein